MAIRSFFVYCGDQAVVTVALSADRSPEDAWLSESEARFVCQASAGEA
ncbi:hypothetical protein [Bradyrhizobium ottawaense]|nr:hypothetical protein [Bradyrhizobium ottawaense]MBR1363443.1 hypothetical protein [Bradyrhizobium ottawaense]